VRVTFELLLSDSSSGEGAKEVLRVEEQIIFGGSWGCHPQDLYQRARNITMKGVDYEGIKYWLETCTKYHGNECISSATRLLELRSSSARFRLVDTKLGCIVEKS